MPGIKLAGDRFGAQRRHAAVLFADLSGFTTLVDSVEPETVYALIRPLMDELVALVDVHGGDIQQVLGDGFMSVFGITPQRDDRHHRSDNVQRAVRAGIALASSRRCLHAGLPVHVGIECGDVLVSPSWQPARFAVWGRAVTIATRLCDLAGPGTVNIGPQAFTHGGRQALHGRHVGPLTSTRTPLKGIAEDVIIHSLTCPAEPMPSRPAPWRRSLASSCAQPTRYSPPT